MNDKPTLKFKKKAPSLKFKTRDKSPPKIMKKLDIKLTQKHSGIPLRLGYACLNMTISQGSKSPACVNRSCIADTFTKKGVDYVVGLAMSNLKNVLKVLKWNEEKGIRFYRLSSNMLPHCTNPNFIKDGSKYAYDLEQFRPICEQIGQYARDMGHRLTYHPGQFDQVGTPNREVFEKTKTDLAMHADMLDMMGMGPDSVMIVHGGGTYGDKPTTMKRWAKQFAELPENVRNRLVIENCEKCYSPLDMLELSDLINRPVVFDTHHHTCYSNEVEKLPDPREFLPRIIETWRRVGVKPKFHISEQDPTKRVGAHSQYVEVIPDYLLELIKGGVNIDLMIEAKCKELAVHHLYRKYCVLYKGIWYLDN